MAEKIDIDALERLAAGGRAVFPASTVAVLLRRLRAAEAAQRYANGHIKQTDSVIDKPV